MTAVVSDVFVGRELHAYDFHLKRTQPRQQRQVPSQKHPAISRHDLIFCLPM